MLTPRTAVPEGSLIGIPGTFANFTRLSVSNVAKVLQLARIYLKNLIMINACFLFQVQIKETTLPLKGGHSL